MLGVSNFSIVFGGDYQYYDLHMLVDKNWVSVRVNWHETGGAGCTLVSLVY